MQPCRGAQGEDNCAHTPDAVKFAGNEHVRSPACCKHVSCHVSGPPRVGSNAHDIEPSNIEPHSHHDVHAQYAGNVLVYGGISPNEGDWFGGVTADDAEQLLTALTEIEVGPRPTRAWFFLCPTGLR